MSTPAQAITGQNDQATVQGFASKVRAKFPGSYDDMDDTTLAQKVVAKHPEYSDILPKSFGTAPVAPVPLPGQGQRVMGTTWDSELKPQPEVLGQPIMPLGAVSVPQFIGGLAGGVGGSKAGEYAGEKFKLGSLGKDLSREAGGLLGTLLGSGAGAEAEDLYPRAKETIGRTLRVQPTADNSPTTGTIGKAKTESTLTPGVKAAASTLKLVGGPKIANALIPDYPEPVGPFSRVASGPVPKQVDPVAAAVKSRTASWIPTTVPKPASTPLTESPYYNDIAAARSAAREDAANANINRPGWTAKLSTRVPSGSGALGQVRGGVPDVNVVPEPRELLPEDRPGAKWSIKRSELPGAAQRRIPGAGSVMQNLGKTVIYTPKEGVGYPGPREAAPLGRILDEPPTSSTPQRGPSSQPGSPAMEQEPEIETVYAKQAAAREARAQARAEQNMKDSPETFEDVEGKPGTKERQPREKLQNFDPDVLDAAKEEVFQAHDKWSQFERPGRYAVDANDPVGSQGPMKKDIAIYSVTSARPQIEAAHPWIRNLPKMTANKLRAAVESGKGVEYTRLLNEAGKHIQTVKEANAPLVEEFRDQLEEAARNVESKDAYLAQTLRDISAGKYSAWSDLSSYLKGKLDEAETTAAFEKAHANAKSTGATEGVQELGPQGSSPRQDAQQAGQLGQIKPKNEGPGP